MRAYERLIRYAAVYTTSDERFDTCPSTERQLDLAHMLADELKALGVADARVDANGYVYGSIPATAGYEEKPSIGFIAHMDTAPDACGENVRPMIHENYDGKDLTLPGGVVLSCAKFPFLKSMAGETLITSDGTTLLGADDKAGIAEIVTLAEELLRSDVPHGKLCIGFTPDEEIGRGADLFDIPGFGADYAYTVDGGDVGAIEYENFNAASAVVEIRGFSVHPGDSKNKMINASNVAIAFHQALPAMERPEHTEMREGFYHLTDMSGDVNAARLEYILRDHDAEKLAYKKETLLHVASRLNELYGSGTVTVHLKDNYQNMIEMIRPHFHLVETAQEAIRLSGLEPVAVPVRGGTDGARLSWMGLPCPNLGTGGFNFHGNAECITAERMDKSVEILRNIVTLYTR